MGTAYRPGKPSAARHDQVTRREVVVGSVAIAIGCADDSGLDLGFDDGDTFDEVMDKLHAAHPEYGDGLANHAPMAAEALVTLGREDRVLSFVEPYSRQLRRLTPGTMLALEAQADALGDVSQMASWIATYESELQDGSPDEVFARHWPLLAPGVSAAGFHGLIRSAHALRSLRRVDTPSRRRELAHALGYWSARHWTLPGTPGARSESGLDVLTALARVKKVDGYSSKPQELIYERMSWVGGNADFVESVETVDLDALPINDAITELTAAASRIFVESGGVGYLHAITGTSALRLVLDLLDAPAAREGLGWVFQALAALHATYPSGMVIPSSVGSSKYDAQALRIAGGNADDEHTIKLTDAVLREYEIAPRAEFLAAGGG